MSRLIPDDDEFVFNQMLRWGRSPLPSFFSGDPLPDFTAQMVGRRDFFGSHGQDSDSKMNHDQQDESSSKRRFFSSCSSSSSWMTRDADGNLVAQDVTRYRDSNGADAEKKVRRVGDRTRTVTFGNDEGQRRIESFQQLKFNQPGHGSEHELLQQNHSIDTTAVQDDAVANEINRSKEDVCEKTLGCPTTPPSAPASEKMETEESKKPPRRLSKKSKKVPSSPPSSSDSVVESDDFDTLFEKAVNQSQVAWRYHRPVVSGPRRLFGSLL